MSISQALEKIQLYLRFYSFEVFLPSIFEVT